MFENDKTVDKAIKMVDKYKKTVDKAVKMVDKSLKVLKLKNLLDFAIILSKLTNNFSRKFHVKMENLLI